MLTLFANPLPFEEAKLSRKAKALLPTELLTRDLDKIRPEIRQALQFSAQTTNAYHAQRIKDLVDKAIAAEEGGESWGNAMQELRNSLDRMKYTPAPGKEGSMEDLRSDPRLRLIVETNQKMAHGFGRWAQSQEETVLDLWPAKEFYRAEDRNEWRDWPAIWSEAGGRFFEGGGDYPQGRMIALKNDEIWIRISRFGLPYPPYDFNSGMSDDRDIDRDEAEALGLIQTNEHVIAEDIEYFEPSSEMQLDDDLKEALLDDLGPGFGFRMGPEGKEVLAYQ